MSRVFQFTVLGVAQTKGSGRAVVSNTTGEPFYKPDNPKTKGWQNTIAQGLAVEFARIRQTLLPFPCEAISLEVWFYLPRPKALLTKRLAGQAIGHTKKPDVDKLVRAATDALTGIAWRDDAQVVDLFVHKRYCAPGEVPRARITIREAPFASPFLQGVV